MVRRGHDPRDRRAHLVRITADGRRAFEQCIPLQQQANAQCWAALSASEQDRLRTLLRKGLRSWRMIPSREQRVHE